MGGLVVAQNNDTPHKAEYLLRLKSAIDWALSDLRAAWTRTIDAIQNSDNRYSLEALQNIKANLLLSVDAHLDQWFSPIYEGAKDKTTLFDLDTPAEELWKLMVCLNRGIFDKRHGDPLVPFLVIVPSSAPGEGPLYLSPNIDGWGVKMPDEA